MADERALGVLTVPVQTDVGVQVTLVHIWTHTHTHRGTEGRMSSPVAVQQRSNAGLCVGLYAMGETALTDAGPHVHGGHEAVVAEAAVLSRDVGALASVTDVRRVLALVNVCNTRTSTNKGQPGQTEQLGCVCVCIKCLCVFAYTVCQFVWKWVCVRNLY